MAADEVAEVTTSEDVQSGGEIPTTNEPVGSNESVASEEVKASGPGSDEEGGTGAAEGHSLAKPSVATDPVSNLSDENDKIEESPATEPVPVDSSAFKTKPEAAAKGWRFIYNDKHSAHAKTTPDGKILVRPWSYAGPDFEVDDEESAFAQMP